MIDDLIRTACLVADLTLDEVTARPHRSSVDLYRCSTLCPKERGRSETIP